MRSPREFLHIVLAGLIGTVSGILLSSFVLSAYGAAQNGLTWSDLSNIASFWNGHLGSLALLLLALSLYYQSQQLIAQREAERAQNARFRHEVCRTTLDMLVARLHDLGERLRAHLVNNQSNPCEVQSFVGLRQCLAVLQESERNEDYELWVDQRPLADYAEVSDRVTALCKQLLTLDPGAELPAVYRSHSEQRLREYVHQRRLRDRQFLNRLREHCTDELALTTLANMQLQGWELDSHHSGGRFFLKARRFTATFNRVDVLGADNCATVLEACQNLMRAWHQRYK